MGKLYLYEWKKLFRNRSFLFFTAALLLGNVFALFQYEKHKEYYVYFYQLKQEWQAYSAGDNTVPNAEYYQTFQTQAEQYVSSYDYFLKQIPEQAEKQKKMANYQNQDTYLYRNLIKTVSDYSDLSSVGVEADPSVGIIELSSYDYGIYFQLVFLFVLSYFLVSMERKKGLFLLTKGTKKGHSSLVTAKILTMISASMLYSCLQECGTVFLLAYFYGYGNLSRKIQSVSVFRDCSISFTVAEAMLALIMVRLLIGVFCAVLMSCLTISIRREGAAFLIYAGVMGIGMFLNHFVQINSSWNIVKCVNIFFTWNMRNLLGTYLNLNIFGYPVDKFVITIAVGIVLVCILILIGLYRFSASCQVSNGNLFEKIGEKIARRTSFQWHHTSVFRFEVRKVFFQQKRGYLFLILFLWCVFSIRESMQPVFYDNPDEGEYHRIISQISGSVTDESLSYISEQRVEMDKLYEELENTEQKEREQTTLTKELLMHEILMREGGVTAVENQRDLLMLKSGDIFDKFWIDEKDYISKFYDYQYDLIVFLFGAALMVLWMSGIEASDEEKGLYPLLYSTRAGKKQIQKKKTHVCMMGMFWCMVCTLIPQVLRYYKIDHFQNERQRLSDFTLIECGTSVCIGMFIFLVFLAKIALFIIVFWLLLILTKKVRNTTIVIGIGICCIGIAVLLLWYFHMDLTILFLEILRL